MLPLNDHLKLCYRCGENKPISGFSRRKSGSVVTPCKKCKSQLSVEWAKKNPEKRRAVWQKWQAANLDRHNEQARAWSARHPDRKKEVSNAWVDRNPELRKQVACDYVKRNLDKANALWHKRRARIRGNGGSHTPEDIERLIPLQGGKCANMACRVPLKHQYEIDHIMPIAKGGSDNVDNLQLLCPLCNRKKSAKDPIVWAQENGLLF